MPMVKALPDLVACWQGGRGEWLCHLTSVPGLSLFSLGPFWVRRRQSRAGVSPTSGNLEIVLPGEGGFLLAPPLPLSLLGAFCAAGYVMRSP